MNPGDFQAPILRPNGSAAWHENIDPLGQIRGPAGIIVAGVQIG